MATPTEIPTATPTKEPTPTPKPELPSVITPEMVDQYFVGITAEEAQRLFAETGKFVLPFDPTTIEGEFSINEVLAQGSAASAWVIGFRVPSGTEFTTPFVGRIDVLSDIRHPNGSFSHRAVSLESNLASFFLVSRKAIFLLRILMLKER